MKIDRSLPIPLPTTLSQAPLTLADLADFVSARPDLTAKKRRDLRSAINSLAAYIGKPATSIVADGCSLRPRIERLHHAQLGISEGRLDNVISGVKSALGLASAAFPGARRRAQLASPAWRTLRGTLPPNTKFVYHLSRFISFCDADGIAPEAVDDDTFRRFLREDLEITSLRKDPKKAYRSASKWWNLAVEQIPGWPIRAVEVPSFRKPPKNIPLGQLPASFQADLDACEKDLLSFNPFNQEGKTKAYEATTATTWKKALARAVSALVKRGHCSVEDITSVSKLVEPAAAEAILLYYYTQAGEQTTKYTHLLANILYAVAKSYVKAPDSDLTILKANIKCMAPGEDGLTEKNRERLRQFDEPHNKLLILDAHNTLVRQAMKNGCRRKRDAIDLMVAAAVGILLFAPVRLANLASIRMNTHLHWPRRGGGDGQLYFPGIQVKNDEPLEFGLPDEVMRIINLYLEKARGRWLGADDDRLFPHGGNRGKEAHFGDLISGRIAKATGLKINTHLFRHLAAKLYLDDHPGNYEVVRQLLGHKQLRTTIRFYCGFERKAAIKHYDDDILRQREALKALPRRSYRQRNKEESLKGKGKSR